LGLAQELLNLRAGHFDGIEVRRVGGQIKHARTRAFNPFTHSRYPMRFGVISDHNLSGLEDRHQRLVEEL
jgi:hypothetical protein